MSTVRGSQRGFTLIEMMVALLVGVISVIVATEVAQVVVRQTNRGRQHMDLGTRHRMITRMLQADVRLAGMGSTGSIGVDVVRGPDIWGPIAFRTPAGFMGIAAISGANNVSNGTDISGRQIAVGTDVLQLVVPNPATNRRTGDIAEIETNSLEIEGDATIFETCSFAYVIDHSAPNGAGRAQILTLGEDPVNGQTLSSPELLQFNVAANSEVMCARVSTYWTDRDGWLHRTDLLTDGAPVRLPQTRVVIDPDGQGGDLLLPGILDLQIAYRFSAEVYALGGAGAPNAQAGRWAFMGDDANVERSNSSLADLIEGGDATSGQAWTEARRLRFSLLTRISRYTRGVEEGRGDQLVISSREDGPDRELSLEQAAEWVTVSELAANLRYFDRGAEAGLKAEPF